MLEIINESNFDEKVLNAKGEVFVEFFATWCPHCQRMKPIVNELAAQAKGTLAVYQVDVDKSPDLANRYAPNGFPTFAVFQDGRIVQDATGERTLEFLQDLAACRVS